MKTIYSILILSFFTTSLFSQFWEQDFTPGSIVNNITSKGDTLFVTGDLGVWRSYDSGDSWENVTGTLENVQDVILIDNRLFASDLDNGVFISIDFGNTWEPFNNGLEFETGMRNLGKGGLGTIYLSAGNGNQTVYSSSTLSSNWTVVVFSFGGINDIKASGSTACIATELQGTYLSTDGGTTWQIRAQGLPTSQNMPQRVQSVGVSNAGDIYCGVKDSGVYKYNPNNFKWEAKNNGITEANNGADASYNDLYVKGDILLVGTNTGNVYLSTDAGENFSNIADGEFVSTKSLAVNQQYIFATNNGVQRRTYEDFFVLTSTNEPNQNHNFAVYPNPSTGIFQVAAKKHFSSYDIIVTDLLGKQHLLLSDQFEPELTINLNHLSAGVYIVTFVNDNKVVVHNKVIISY